MSQGGVTDREWLNYLIVRPIVQKMSKNPTAAHIKACANKIAFLYESLDKTFKELTWELREFAAKDLDTHEAIKMRSLIF